MESARINGRGPSRFAGNSGFKGMIVIKSQQQHYISCWARPGSSWTLPATSGRATGRSSNRLFGVSDDPYDLWFWTRMRGITGIDLGKPEAAGPSELVFESPVLRPEVPAGALATVMPILPGRKGEWLEFISEFSNPRVDEYRAYLYCYGFARERFFLQHTPHGLMAILYAEGKNPAGAIARFARSHHPFDAWMREEMLFLNGIDFIRRASAPAPDLVLDWKAEPKRVAA